MRDLPASGARRDATVVDVLGDLDHVRAAELVAALRSLTEAGERAVLLDLSGIELMSVGALRILALETARVARSARDLTVRCSDVVGRLLELSGMPELVAVELSAPTAHPAGRTPAAGVAERAPTLVAATTGPGGGTTASGAALLRAAATTGELRVLVNLARASVQGADGASVSLVREGEMTTAAASDEVVRQMDAGQQRTRQGPCLAASMEQRRYSVSSLEHETRWAAFIPIAMALGIRSILSTPIRGDGAPGGALNLYSSATAAFGRAEQELAAVFAKEASRLLSAAGALEVHPRDADWPGDALRKRELISQAQGVLMDRAGIGEDAAFDQLRRSSQRTGRPLVDRAQDVVDSTRRPGLDDSPTPGTPDG